MQTHQVRWLPVVDGHELVGLLRQADIAKYYPEDSTCDLVRRISLDRAVWPWCRYPTGTRWDVLVGIPGWI